jgi:predicted small lipoprotein YifL
VQAAAVLAQTEAIPVEAEAVPLRITAVPVEVEALPTQIEAAPVQAAEVLEPVLPDKTPAPAVPPFISSDIIPEPEPEPDPPLDPILALAEQVRAVQEGSVAAVPVHESAPESPTLVEPPNKPVPLSGGLGELATAAEAGEVREAVQSPQEPIAALAGLGELASAIEAEVPQQPASIGRESEPVALLAPPTESVVAPLLLSAPAAEIPAPQAVASAVDLAPSPAVSEPEAAPLTTDKPVVNNPPSGSRLALAPLQNYGRSISRIVKPAAPSGTIVGSDTGPRMTLPGPSLPPNLASFQDASVAVEGRDKKTRAPLASSVPGWLVSLLVMMTLLGIGVAGVLYFMPPARSNADSKDVPAETQAPAAQTPVAQTPVAQTGAHPLAQTIEVTGFRIVLDPNHKSEIHYVVVNHSAAALSGLTVYVTLRSANAKPGQPPLSHFSFRSPELGPFEAKEMISSIEKSARTAMLPDWSDLRAEVQVAQQ